MREALRSLLVALQFLTRLPVRLSAMPTPEQFGRAVLCYPLVGVLIGVVLYAAARSLDGTPPLLQAALLLSLWVALSGALHLDGLADMADAWIGGLGDRERTLAIMKDPRSGPVAVVVLVLVLLLKFSALAALLGQGEAGLLPLAPWLARSSLPLLFLTRGRLPGAACGRCGPALRAHRRGAGCGWRRPHTGSGCRLRPGVPPTPVPGIPAPGRGLAGNPREGRRAGAPAASPVRRRPTAGSVRHSLGGVRRARRAGGSSNRR
ncbi:cobalamin synthase (plasmid) [Pseudomonas aeruginosa VRFPA03]|nr:cobalamin synthase [Pseudomonas aeruginosa VRFPA03]